MKEKELFKILGEPEKVLDDHELDTEEFIESLRDSIKEYMGLVLRGKAKIIIELDKASVPVRAKILSKKDQEMMFMTEDIEDIELFINVVDKFKIDEGVEYLSVEN